ncbi:MAG: helix-turn-helix domain-containing protein [Acidobacteriia bacterium]|nr:helix-turn-helix domain-containing protein [Terriglobia bacterium]
MARRANRPGHVTKADIFDDLEFSPSEAASLKIKARILSALLKRIQQQRYTQARLAELLDDYQPNISNLLNGKISKMSIEKLLTYAHRLNLDAEITMKMRPRSARSKKVRVA